MQGILRPRPEERRKLLRLFFLFIAAGVVSNLVGQGHLAAHLVLTAFWGSWALYCMWTLRKLSQVQLEIDGDQLIQHGAASQTISLADVTDLRWAGTIVVRTEAARIAIDQALYTPAERLALIRHLRRSVPATAQRNWPEFCRSIAVPLRDGRPARREGDVWVTRQKRDRMFGGLLTLSIVATFPPWVIYSFHRGMLIPLAIAGMWIFMRYAIPRHGAWVPPAPPFGKAMLISVIVQLGLFVAWTWMPRHEELLNVGMVIAALNAIACPFVGHRAAKQWLEREQHRAVEAWDRCEPKLPSEPVGRDSTTNQLSTSPKAAEPLPEKRERESLLASVR